MTFGLSAVEAVSLAASVNSLTGGGITSALGLGPKSMSGSQAQQAADPFSPYRDKLAQLYSGALQPGASQDPTAMPGYSQWKTGVLDPSLEASKRSAAASGMLYSTNEQQNLQKTAQGGYYGFMTDYLNRLAQGSGAVQNPAQAAALGLSQGNLNQQGIMQGLGGIATTMSGLSGQFGTSTPVDMTGFQTPYTSPTYTVDAPSMGSGMWGIIPPGP